MENVNEMIRALNEFAKVDEGAEGWFSIDEDITTNTLRLVRIRNGESKPVSDWMRLFQFNHYVMAFMEGVVTGASLFSESLKEVAQ